MSDYFHFRDSRFHFYKTGKGADALIALHGFGQNGQMFDPITESLGTRYTIYSFDFAYHGKTVWNEETAFTQPLMTRLLSEFMRQNGLSKISLMGFSMGGRVVMSLISEMAPVLREVFLLAPDGISERIYYRDVIANPAGDAVFRSIMNHPGALVKATQLFSRLGLTKKYVADYVKSYFGEERRRVKIYNIWRSMQTFRTRLPVIRESALKHGIKIYLFWGKRDKVLPVRYALRFKRAVPSCELLLLDGGHFIVNERLNPVIHSLIK